MIYVMSDIHGCGNMYHEMLRKIQFCDSDHLYILGDAIDRGPDGISILEDIMRRRNVTMLLGNHEHMMLDAIFHPEDDMLNFRWESNGAYPTYQSVCLLAKEKQEAILDFLSGLSLETAISCNGHTYRLVHAAPAYMFAEYNRRNWDETTFCVWYRIRKEDTVSADETLIFGHTPTYRYSHGLPVSIWHGQNRIDIDCGAGHGYGGRLACLRLDDMAEFYVDAQ